MQLELRDNHQPQAKNPNREVAFFLFITILVMSVVLLGVFLYLIFICFVFLFSLVFALMEWFAAFFLKSYSPSRKNH
jgi:uncharacterized membrane protein